MLQDFSNGHRKAAASEAAPSKAEPRRLAPVPGHFFLGSAVEAWRDPLKLFASTVRGEDIVRYKFFYLDYFLVNEPSAIQHVLVSNAANYKKSRNYAGLKVVLGEGLLTSEGSIGVASANYRSRLSIATSCGALPPRWRAAPPRRWIVGQLSA